MDKEEEVQILCHNILLLRKKASMTQKEMAAIMDISVSGLRRIESGKLPPRLSLDAIFSLADAFSISPFSLFQP